MKKYFKFLLILIIFLLSGCSAAIISEWAYGNEFKDKVGKMTYAEALIEYGNPDTLLFDKQYKLAIYRSYTGGSVAITNSERGFLTGRRLRTTNYVDTSHGCTLLLVFNLNTDILEIYKLKDCR